MGAVGGTTGLPAAHGVADGADPPELGTIQSHGFLLGIDPATSVIAVASANLAAFTGLSPAAALGSTLADLLGMAVADRLAFPEAGVPGEAQPRTVRLPPLPLDLTPGPADLLRGRREPWDEFEVVSHQNGALWVLEFEPVADNQVGLGSLYDSFRRTLDHLRTVDGIAALCEAAAQEVRALTGYDRVLVYRFDATAQGDIVAEARCADMDPYLGLSYPAADISPQARAQYLRSWLRLVADVDDEPSGLVGAPGRRRPGSTCRWPSSAPRRSRTGSTWPTWASPRR